MSRQILSEAERKELLKDAPRLVEYGLSMGWLTRPGETNELVGMTPEEIRLSCTFEESKPRPDQYLSTSAGFRSFRSAYQQWAKKRATALAELRKEVA